MWFVGNSYRFELSSSHNIQLVNRIINQRREIKYFIDQEKGKLKLDANMDIRSSTVEHHVVLFHPINNRLGDIICFGRKYVCVRLCVYSMQMRIGCWYKYIYHDMCTLILIFHSNSGSSRNNSRKRILHSFEC